MSKIKIVIPQTLIILFSCISLFVIWFLYFYRQPKIYQSFWYETNYVLTFHADSTYEVKTKGHLGGENVNMRGKYKIQRDTIHLVSGFDKSSGLISEKYLKLGDSVIIDLENFWDYKIMWNNKHSHAGRERFEFFRKPNLDTLVVLDKQKFDAIIKQCTYFLKNTDERSMFNNDTDHLHTGIIRLLNTFKTTQDNSLKNNFYKEFANIIKERNYEELASKRHFMWIPCKDGGLYSRTLKIEFGGEIHAYSKYTIKN